MKSMVILCAIAPLCSCMSGRPDNFYILSPQPQAVTQSAAVPATPIVLRITLPSLVDRPEIVLNTSIDGVKVLDHDRWGAPLGDLVAQTLGQDIERRRGDLLVGVQGAAHMANAAVKITIDVIQLTARPGDHVSIETHWRIVDTRKSTDVAGNGVFSASLGQDANSRVAQALSECLGRLADRLVTQIQ
jgi:uncharacterized protein